MKAPTPKRIRCERERRRLTQPEMARQLGEMLGGVRVSHMTIWRWEHAQRTPSGPYLVALVKWMEIPDGRADR